MRTKAPQQRRPLTTHIATEPRQVWCWDMTYLPAKVQGQWFHLYLTLDLNSRKIVGWEVHDSDHADHAAHLVRRKALAEGIGVTLSIATVAFVTSAQPSAMLVRIKPFSPLDMRCMPGQETSIPHTG